MDNSTAPDMISTGKVAELIGVTPAKVKKAIEELQLEAAAVKCRCSYYTPDQVDKIKELIKK